MSKVYFRANEFKESIIKSKDITFERGYLTGFKTLEEYISFKVGYTTYLYSYPHVGKSVFMADILISLAVRYGIKICLFSPEFGKKEALIHSLIQSYTAKKMYGSNKQLITDEEIFSAIEFIDKHFVILDPPKKSARKKMESLDFTRFSFEAAYNQIYKAEKEYGWDIKIFVADPFNHVEKKEEDDRKQTADYILETLLLINEASEQLNLHSIVVNHLRDTDRITDKDTGIEYYPKPFPNELLGGQQFWRAGYQMIGLHRNPAGVIEKKTGTPYRENSTEVLIQKSKPFGAGKVGECRLFFDDSKQRFYEVIDGEVYYAGEYEEKFNQQALEGRLNKPSGMPVSSWFDPNEEAPF